MRRNDLQYLKCKVHVKGDVLRDSSRIYNQIEFLIYPGTECWHKYSSSYCI